MSEKLCIIYTHCLAKTEVELKYRTVYILVQGEVSKIGLPEIAQHPIKNSFVSLKQTAPPSACCIISLRLGRCRLWRITEAEAHTDHFPHREGHSSISEDHWLVEEAFNQYLSNCYCQVMFGPQGPRLELRLHQGNRYNYKHKARNKIGWVQS